MFKKVAAVAVVCSTGLVFLGCASHKTQDATVKHVGPLPLFTGSKKPSLEDSDASKMGLFRPIGDKQFCEAEGGTAYHIKKPEVLNRTTFNELYGVLCVNLDPANVKTFAVLKDGRGACLGKAVPALETIGNKWNGEVVVSDCGGTVAYTMRRKNPLSLSNMVREEFIILDNSQEVVGRLFHHHGTDKSYDYTLESVAGGEVGRFGGVPFWKMPFRSGWQMEDKQGQVVKGNELPNPIVFKERKWIYLLGAARAMMNGKN